MLLSWAKRKHMFEEIRLSESEVFFFLLSVCLFFHPYVSPSGLFSFEVAGGNY